METRLDDKNEVKKSNIFSPFPSQSEQTMLLVLVVLSLSVACQKQHKTKFLKTELNNHNTVIETK